MSWNSISGWRVNVARVEWQLEIVCVLACWLIVTPLRAEEMPALEFLEFLGSYDDEERNMIEDEIEEMAPVSVRDDHD